MTIAHADFRFERHYPYTPAQVFSAFSEPDLRSQWFGNAGGFTDYEWNLDFRVGGGEFSAGSSPDRQHHAFKSRFHDIVAAQQIVFTYDLLIDHELISVSLGTFEFIAEGDGTSLVFSEQGAFFGGPEAAAQREHGSGKLIDLLGEFLDGHFGSV